MKKFLTIILVLSIGLQLFGCSTKTNDRNKEDSQKNLIVGMELAYPPFEMTDENNNATGISVDLAQELGKSLGRTVKIENMSFAGLIPALQTKKIDIIISSMTITEERKKTIDFSDAYANSNLAILINKNSSVKKVEDLNVKGKKLAVKKGTTGHVYAEKNLPNCEVMVFDKESACVLEVTQGKADAFIYDQMTIYDSWKRNADTTRAELMPFQKDPEQWGIALRKEDSVLKGDINKFLKEFKGNGGFDKLAEKYLTEQKKTFKELGIPFFF